MFKKRLTKAELRSQLEAEVSRFLEKGGQIEKVEMGASGLIDGRYNMRQGTFTPSSSTTQTRTPVTNVLATIDARRKTNSKSSACISRQKSPRKKVIYDDFGEPIRTVWIDE